MKTQALSYSRDLREHLLFNHPAATSENMFDLCQTLNYERRTPMKVTGFMPLLAETHPSFFRCPLLPGHVTDLTGSAITAYLAAHGVGGRY